jgi:hypothetical protein
VDTIVDDAQHDILRRAHPPTVITEEDAAALAVGYPQLLATLNLDTDTIAELVSGTRDVFTAACGDQLSGLHGPKGRPCPARPGSACSARWRCSRHDIWRNLLRLKAFFSRQWRQMPAAQFLAVFGPYAGASTRSWTASMRPRSSPPRRRFTTVTRRSRCGPRSGQHDRRPPSCSGSAVAFQRRGRLPGGRIFEHDLWDFTDVVGLPVDMPLANRRFDFAAIANPRWRLVAKELMHRIAADPYAMIDARKRRPVLPVRVGASPCCSGRRRVRRGRVRQRGRTNRPCPAGRR